MGSNCQYCFLALMHIVLPEDIIFRESEVIHIVGYFVSATIGVPEDRLFLPWLIQQCFLNSLFNASFVDNC